ncbi:MAG TPA: DevR family CRISPR-associated autoregulator [Paenibacillus sp.]|uniref:DevR family CRISPR-associated autoregulator n=1 Tax=Paenibacillus sp. TaxID=58172 RepID=UPI0028D1C212|nr:DevR family CRISPR-associated autoregulator [Paenibacillus sp.]HUC93258.1 DevR family CRISPR-associated autoregulator [Paenibacillus sp.]
MPTYYLYGTVLTGEAVAANNRGDNMGNTTTLQKVFQEDDLHTSVSAEAIRFAIRYRFQLEGLMVNRSFESSEGKLFYEDEKRAYWSGGQQVYIDDDLMGFMDAAAAKVEQETEAESVAEDASEGNGDKARPKGGRAKGKTTRRQSPLAVGRAVSLRPYRGELSFNAVSGEKEKGKLSLYSAEMHTTEYQYSFGLNLGDVRVKEHIAHLMDAIADMPPVAGNHARFAYDFSPASIVLRVTSAHSSKIQNCFRHDEETRGYHVGRLTRRVETGDIPASELIVGGEIADTYEGNRLKELGVFVSGGVDQAIAEAKRRIAESDEQFAVLRQA